MQRARDRIRAQATHSMTVSKAPLPCACKSTSRHVARFMTKKPSLRCRALAFSQAQKMQESQAATFTRLSNRQAQAAADTYNPTACGMLDFRPHKRKPAQITPHASMRLKLNGTVLLYSVQLCCSLRPTGSSDEGRHRGRIKEFGEGVARHCRQISRLSLPDAAVRL